MDAAIDTLISEEVVDLTAETVSISPPFLDEVTTERETIRNTSRDTLILELKSSLTQSVAATLADNVEIAAGIIATYRALSARLTDSTADRRLHLAVVLDAIVTTDADMTGVPQSFIPVKGEVLPVLFSLYSRSLVYIWRHDCPPCEQVRSDLEALLPADTEIATFAVNGPNWSSFLQHTYDIVGGPTVLFVKEEAISSRLYGAQPREVLEKEIAVLESD